MSSIIRWIICVSAAFSMVACSKFKAPQSKSTTESIGALKAQDFLDTGANNNLTENSDLFYFEELQNGARALTTKSELTNIHSHLVNDMKLKSMMFTGRVHFSSARSGLGMTFLSQYPQSDSYYRIRRYSGKPNFHFSHHPHAQRGVCDGLSHSLVTQANTWYRFVIKTQVRNESTTFTFDLWPEGSARPENTMISCTDTSSTRLREGTIGVWSMGEGVKKWADFSLSLDPFEDNTEIPVSNTDTPSSEEPNDEQPTPEPTTPDLNPEGLIYSSEEMTFNGSAAQVVSHSPEMESRDGTLIMAFYTETLNLQQGLFSKDSSDYDDGGHLTTLIQYNTLSVRMQSTSTSHSLSYNGLKAYHNHVMALSFGSEGLKLFVDGQLADSTSYQGGLIGNKEPIVLGGNQWSSGNQVADQIRDILRGKIHYTKLYNKALTPQEIAEFKAPPHPEEPSLPEEQPQPIPDNSPTPIPDSSAPAWSLGTTSNGHLVVDTKSEFGQIVFAYDRSNEVVKNPPVGHNLPSGVEHRLFYNLLIDGYQGLPPGNCLTRSEFMSDSDPTKSICARTENKDLLRNWSQGSRGAGFKNVLIKNVTVKNAIRTINAEASNLLPHVDTFQSYYSGSATEIATSQWMVIQDSIMKNSDNSLMISGGNGSARGVVYQNLKAGFCDSWFYADGKKRMENDFIRKGLQPKSTYHYCTNSMMAQTITKGDIWLINSESSGSILAEPQGGNLILIGSSRSQSFRSGLNIGNRCEYQYIEDALNDTNSSDGCGNFKKPPFLELSCSGWKNPPTGCEASQGFKSNN